MEVYLNGRNFFIVHDMERAFAVKCNMFRAYIKMIADNVDQA